MGKDTRKEGHNDTQRVDRQVDTPGAVEDDERNPEFERFEEFVKKIAAVPKEELDEERRKYEEERETKRAG